MSKLTQVLLLLAIAFLSWQCGSEANNTDLAQQQEVSSAEIKPTQSIPSFSTITAQPSDQSSKLTINGRVQALEQLRVVAEVQGKALATKKLLNEGTRYRKGETMILIDKTQYELNLKAQKSQFQTALVRIMSQIQLDYPSAHPAWDTYLSNFDPKDLLPELPKVEDDQLRYFLSANNVYSTFYNIKSAEELLPKYQIVSPFNGVVAQGSVSAGAVVSPGIPLATLHRTDVYELKAAISSKDVQRLKVGQKIKLAHNNTGESWTGTVNRLGATMDAGTQSVPVFIRVSGRGLRAGMFLEAKLDGDKLEKVVELPLTALNRNNQVHHIKNETVELLAVQPLRYEEATVWVTGFKGGEKVIVEEINEPIVGSKANPR